MSSSDRNRKETPSNIAMSSIGVIRTPFKEQGGTVLATSHIR